METQAAIAVPTGEDDAITMHVTTQSPDSTQVNESLMILINEPHVEAQEKFILMSFRCRIFRERASESGSNRTCGFNRYNNVRLYKMLCSEIDLLSNLIIYLLIWFSGYGSCSTWSGHS